MDGDRRARSHFRFARPTHPLHTRFANIIGISLSEATMRPNPRRPAHLGHQRRADGSLRARPGLGRIVALHHRAFTSYQVR
jgi:hypothetical protein